MSYFAESARQKRAKIDAFTSANGLAQRHLTILGKQLLLLDLGELENIPPQRLEGYVEQHIASVATERTIGGSCLFIAGDAVRNKRASGRVGTRDNEERFAGFVNHYINYDLLPDGTVVGIDLTASHNIAEGYGGLDVLAVHATNLGNLCLSLGNLYGGTWQDVNDMEWS